MKKNSLNVNVFQIEEEEEKKFKSMNYCLWTNRICEAEYYTRADQSKQ